MRHGSSFKDADNDDTRVAELRWFACHCYNTALKYCSDMQPELLTRYMTASVAVSMCSGYSRRLLTANSWSIYSVKKVKMMTVSSLGFFCVASWLRLLWLSWQDQKTISSELSVSLTCRPEETYAYFVAAAALSRCKATNCGLPPEISRSRTKWLATTRCKFRHRDQRIRDDSIWPGGSHAAWKLARPWQSVIGT